MKAEAENQFIQTIMQAKTEILDRMKKDKIAIAALDELLVLYGRPQHPILGEREPMAKGNNRRRGGMSMTLQALKILGAGSIRHVAEKLQELYPLDNEINLISKVSTYLKRLYEDGDAMCDHSGKVKIYSFKERNAA